MCEGVESGGTLNLRNDIISEMYFLISSLRFVVF